MDEMGSAPIEVTGAHNTALCFAAELDELAARQIKEVCDRPEFAECKIRIMPDVHAGMGCVIGTTMTIHGRAVPGMVGVDIGCGMETAILDDAGIDFSALDELIRKEIPFGTNIRRQHHEYNDEIDLTELRCADHIKLERARRSIGTLGGGNHFIEVGRLSDGSLCLVIHSGSRHMGKEIAEYYQGQALRSRWGGTDREIQAAIERLKAEGRAKEISAAMKEMRRMREADIPRDLTYVEGELFDDYIHDMRIAQRYAALNRRAMTEVIVSGLGLSVRESFTTIHNYIDTDEMILRKGAVSAKAGEKILIPLNMRDGSLICVGRGNKEWNSSAPHGAGRRMSRRQAFASLSVDEFKAEMEGIWTTCVGRDTLDEAPMAYKDGTDIESRIAPTAEIVDRSVPLYNFKASEQSPDPSMEEQ